MTAPVAAIAALLVLVLLALALSLKIITQYERGTSSGWGACGPSTSPVCTWSSPSSNVWSGWTPEWSP